MADIGLRIVPRGGSQLLEVPQPEPVDVVGAHLNEDQYQRMIGHWRLDGDGSGLRAIARTQCRSNHHRDAD